MQCAEIVPKEFSQRTRASICFDFSTPREAIAKEVQIVDELSFDILWQTADVVLVDNLLVMHGRRPFEGQRRVLASLIAD